jgi:RNA polymerase sigma-70 factor (ECF subfamily)
MDPDSLEAARRLSAARAGSREALGEALEACRCYLLGVADRELDDRLRAKGGASDLVQETFLEAQRDFARFDGQTEEELLAWLRQILRNNLANFARRYRGTDKRNADREVVLGGGNEAGGAAPPLAAGTPTPSQQVSADEQRLELLRAIDRLPEDYRRILTLRYLEERAFDEIARLMGRSDNAVRKLWARAVGLLEKELGIPP